MHIHVLYVLLYVIMYLFFYVKGAYMKGMHEDEFYFSLFVEDLDHANAVLFPEEQKRMQAYVNIVCNHVMLDMMSNQTIH